MFLNLKNLAVSYSVHMNVTLSTVRVGPDLVALVCIRRLIILLGVYNFLVFVIYFRPRCRLFPSERWTILLLFLDLLILI
jgi:hypothetical protein